MKTSLINEQHKTILYKMLMIRMVEEEIAKQYPKGKMRCPTHLSIGQEGVAAMICEYFTKEDLVVSTHRGHAHYLAKGGSLKGLIAELYGKVTGATRGRGGSMNLSDLSAGFVASTAIVGNTVPLGVGLAFAQQLKKSNAVSGIFLGDAAVEEGAVYESLNFAVLKKLPVIFICENNLYSVNTHIRLRQPLNRAIYKMAEGIGAKVAHIDGNNVLKSLGRVGEIMCDLRQQGGPWFVEFETYRYKVHCGPEDDNGLDRPAEEFDYWMGRDPLFLLQQALVKADTLSIDEISQKRLSIQKEIDEAFMLAENAPFPQEEERFMHKYADSHAQWLEKALNGLKQEVSID